MIQFRICFLESQFGIRSIVFSSWRNVEIFFYWYKVREIVIRNIDFVEIFLVPAFYPKNNSMAQDQPGHKIHKTTFLNIYKKKTGDINTITVHI